MEEQRRMPLQRLPIMSHTHFLKQWYLLAANARPLFLVCIYMQKLPFTACTEPHPLICCCRSSTPAVCQGIFTCSRLIVPRSHFHLYKPRSCVCKLMVPTPTDPSRYLFVYHEYTLLDTWKVLLAQFLSVSYSLPIQVTSRSHPGLTQIAIRASSRNLVSKLIVITGTD